MLRRARPPSDPVTIYLDDSPVVAERGEPIAVTLLAADAVTIARSPKLHRPRGPSCLRGGCDGCLARVDGEPNVMTCLRPVRGGERVEAQNVVGSRKSDLLRVTDWFFPQGIDHHHLMAGVPGVRDIMQSFARKLAGLGRLPAEALAARPAARLEVGALVVGGGLSGLTIASRLAQGGHDVHLVDDGLELGGALLGAPELLRASLAALPLGRARVHRASAAVGVYPVPASPAGLPLETVLVSAEGSTVVRARALVFTTGAHDGGLATQNNDLPGVFSARALCRLAARGVSADGPVAIVGDGFWADRLEEALAREKTIRVREEDVVAIKGTSQVRGIDVRGPDGATRTPKVVAVAAATRPLPSFELCAQAGARVRYEPGVGYVVERDANGRVAPGIWAAGECAGLSFDPPALSADAEKVAADVAGALNPR